VLAALTLAAAPRAHTYSTFGTNHLGHFLFALHLLEQLRLGAPSRVVSLASLTHTTATIPFELLDYWAMVRADYRRANKPLSELAHTLPCAYPWAGRARSLEELYRESKLANILFAFEFNRRYSHLCIYANALCPGVVASDILRVRQRCTHHHRWRPRSRVCVCMCM